MTKKIKVVQYMHGYFAHFNWMERINRSYCERHGYEYVVRRDTPLPDRYPSWEKIEVMKSELKDCDYLLYLDGDAFFYSREFKIESELLPMLGSKSIMMAQNFMSEKIRRVPKYPNSGVILLKNNEISRKFLISWSNSSEKDPVGCWIPPHEDINLWRLTLKIYHESVAFIEDYYQMNGHYGLFIRHLQGLSETDRVGQAIRFIDQNMKPGQKAESRSGLHIRVLQYMHGNYEYFQWSKLVNAAYCKRHGYEYHVDTTVPKKDRDVVWQKTESKLRYLGDCDYLLFLDADAIFYGQEWRVEDQLIPLMDGYDILMAQDITYERSRWTPGYPNAGVILMKNNQSTRQFVELWRDMPDIVPELKNTWPPMQLALWRYLMPVFPDKLKVLDEYYLMNGGFGQYIRHFMAHSDLERAEAIRTYYEQLLTGSSD